MYLYQAPWRGTFLEKFNIQRFVEQQNFSAIFPVFSSAIFN